MISMIDQVAGGPQPDSTIEEAGMNRMESRDETLEFVSFVL